MTMIMSRLITVSRAIALCAAALVSACSSAADPDPATTCVGHTSSAASTAMAKTVSFEKDVLPIFAASCTFGSCHGSPSGANNGIYLGKRGSISGTDAAAIRTALVERASDRLPSMKYVKPYDASNSYLLRKLDGDFCGIPECAGGTCGDRMPRGGDALEAAKIEIVQAWIAQGATEK
jgi:hypothetical protein